MECARPAHPGYPCDSPCPFCEDGSPCFGRRNPYYEGPCPCAQNNQNSCCNNCNNCNNCACRSCASVTAAAPYRDESGYAYPRETSPRPAEYSEAGACYQRRAARMQTFDTFDTFDMYATCPVCGNLRSLCTCGACRSDGYHLRAGV